MPKDPTPLTESERFQLNRLLDRSGQSPKERELEAKLRARQDKLAAEEAKLSKRLAELRIDLDCTTAEIYKIAPSGVAFRDVAAKLAEFGERAPSLSFFNTPADNLDRHQLMLLGEIALSAFEANSRPKGKPLRDRMQGVRVDVGPDSPGDDGPPDSPAAMAQRILAAAKKARPS
jgi:hypothetical protein